MKKQIFYKVVQKDEFGNWRSSSTPPDHPLCLHYPESEWVYPSLKRSKLFVFSNLECAFHFVKALRLNSFVFECHVKNPKMLLCMYDPHYGVDLKNAEFFWKWFNAKNQWNDSIPMAYPPEGTYAVSAVKLLNIYGTTPKK
jgi:hypothetical protein